MTLPRLALSLMAVAVHGAVAAQVGSIAQQVSLCVTTEIGTCGRPCEPFDCLPNYTLTSPGAVLQMEVGGAPAQPYVLVVGSPVDECQMVVGIEGKLGLWAPMSAFEIGMTTDGAIPSACNAGIARTSVAVPANVVIGILARFQVLAVAETKDAAPVMQFSRATEVRIR
jgi:hypothetical protein